MSNHVIGQYEMFGPELEEVNRLRYKMFDRVLTPSGPGEVRARDLKDATYGVLLEATGRQPWFSENQLQLIETYSDKRERDPALRDDVA